MSDQALDPDPTAIQRARANHLRDLLDPWSLRKIQARTGIGRNAMKTRLDGSTPLGMGDIELLAPLVRMTPTELFTELLTVELPHLDSNQEPIGSALEDTEKAVETIGELFDIGRERRLRHPNRHTANDHHDAGIVTPIAGRG